MCYSYRPPSSKVEWLNSVSESLDKSFNENKETVILGDFNFDLLKLCHNSKSLLQLMESMNFTQLVKCPTIKCPTRIIEYSSTLIDHVFTNIPGNIIELNIPSYALSDHFQVAITRKCNHTIATKPYHNYIMYRSVKHFSDTEFPTDLSNQHWSLLTACVGPDGCTNLFIEIFSSILQKHAPIKRKRVKKVTQPQ